MKVIFVSFLLFGVAWATLSCECGKRNAGRIVGGKVAKKNEYPWMVALQKIYNDFTFCGGTIVTPWHVVTAAHCVDTLRVQQLLLVFGAHDVNDYMDQTRQEIIVDEIIIHPHFNRLKKEADIALLVTTYKIDYNDFVSPACMPSKPLPNQLKGQMVKIIGWGRYNYTKLNEDKIKKLMEIDQEVRYISECDRTQGKNMCTFAPGKDTCRGDSGGPVVWLDPETNRFTLVGVVSSSPKKCGLSNSSSVQTSVEFYKDWIEMKISDTKRGSEKTCHKL